VTKTVSVIVKTHPVPLLETDRAIKSMLLEIAIELDWVTEYPLD
jgi:hypothetical protein